MSKRNTSILIIILFLIALGFISYNFFQDSHVGFDIEIKNNTNENISGLAVTYGGLAQDIAIPKIEAGKTYNLNINPKGNFNENSMFIYYKDKTGYKQKNTLIGYFEKGYSGKIKVNINSIDKNGLIIMQIQEKIKLGL